jgi:hypothetical protein
LAQEALALEVYDDENWRSLRACGPHFTPASGFNLFAGEKIATDFRCAQIAFGMDAITAGLTLDFAGFYVTQSCRLWVIGC